MRQRWNHYRSYLQRRYGGSVYRIGIDGGFSCPNRDEHRGGGCIYCDARGSSAVYQRPDERGFTRSSSFVPSIDAASHEPFPYRITERLESIDRQIVRGKRFLQDRYGDVGQSIYFQAYSNTYDDPAVLQRLYDHALDSGSYIEFIVSTRPDCLSDEIITLLASYRQRVATVWVELGLQSGDDTTLEWIGRGHTVDDFSAAVQRLHDAGIEVCAHVILGFPIEGETQRNLTADVICRTQPEAIKIHNLHVVAGTRLYERYCQEPFHVDTREEHVAHTIALLRRIPEDCVIQRFTSDTPAHRLAAPRDFGDKGQFLADLQQKMEQLDVYQGDLL